MANTIIVWGIFLITGLITGIMIGNLQGPECESQTQLTGSRIQEDCPICRACPPEKTCSNQCPICRACPPEKTCSPCPECPKPPKFQQELNKELSHWIKNECRIKDGAAVYQAGSADTCDQAAEYFEIEGYPRFKTRPKNSIDLSTFYSQGLTVDKTIGYFTFVQFDQYGRKCFNVSQYPDEQERKRWTWNKDQCSKSTITICHL